MAVFLDHPGLSDRIKSLRKIEPARTAFQLGRELGVKGSAVRNWEAGAGAIGAANLAALAAIYAEHGVTVDWLLTGEGVVNSKRTRKKVEQPSTLLTSNGDAALMPVRATRLINDGLFYITEKVIEYVPRPYPLSNREDSYGISVPSDAMAPSFRSGDYAFVDPLASLVVDREVLAIRSSEAEEREARLATLIEVGRDHWVVETPGHPSEKHTLQRSEWEIQRVVVKVWR